MEAISVESRTKRSRELDEIFKRLADETCDYLHSGGSRVQPYRPGLPFFGPLTVLEKEKIIQQLQFFRDLCAEQIEERYEIKDNHSFVWRAMHALGLTPTSDLFNHITQDNMVEIYSSDGFQLFRNFKFFEFCSYSLEELYSIEWWNLYRRDTEAFAKVVEIAQDMNTGKNIGGCKPDIERHSVQEISSDEKVKIDIMFEWIAPVFQNKKIAGCISISRISQTEN